MSNGLQILFLCSRNRRRSLTAEKVFDSVNGHRVRSAGTKRGARIPVTEGLLGWADVVLAMESKHVASVRRRFAAAVAGKKVVCLHVRDEYEYMDEALIQVLRERLGEWFGEPA